MAGSVPGNQSLPPICRCAQVEASDLQGRVAPGRFPAQAVPFLAHLLAVGAFPPEQDPQNDDANEEDAQSPLADTNDHGS